jgi:hypothetical protein
MRTTFHKVSGDVPTYEVDRGSESIGRVWKFEEGWSAAGWSASVTWSARIYGTDNERHGFPTRQAAASWIRENRA